VHGRAVVAEEEEAGVPAQ
jgi:hypothetical protein